MKHPLLACRLALPLAALAASSAMAGAPASDRSYASRPDVRAFAADVAARRLIDVDWLLAQVGLAERQRAAQRLIMPPKAGQAKNWAAYRERFVEPRRILAGVDFWAANADALQRAEDQFGVPAEIIVGIIGVETYFGRVMGNFRVLDALATLAFDFPSGRSDRSGYFRDELEEFLVLAHRERVSPVAVKGSFAGAVGLPQFMPGSINRFAIDFDGDGHVDLHDSAADAIGSVAQFLSRHGWQRGMPTHYPVQPPQDAAARAHLLGPDILPSFTVAQMVEAGAGLPESALPHAGPLALVMVENGDDAPSYVAGTENFYALTRYNRSSYYALAVIELGAAIRRSR